MSARYAVSFTTGGLFHNESLALAQLYAQVRDWDAVRSEAISQNLLQTRTLSTLKRVSREIVSRLRTLSGAEIDFLLDASRQDQAYVLWLAICRRFSLIADFAIEVLRERYISLKTSLAHEDFDAFFNRKADWHPELDQVSDSTRRKLRQVLFRMLREAELLTAQNMICAAMLSPRLLDVIYQGRKEDVFFFPAFDSDLKRGR